MNMPKAFYMHINKHRQDHTIIHQDYNEVFIIGQYKNAISLGFFCSVSSELERFGLRSQSCPFDWIISGSFEHVIATINDGFLEFLNPEHLYQFKSKQHCYINVKNGFQFYHDFAAHKSLDRQIADVSEKYKRRINRFYDSIKEPTLFFRYLSSQKDCDYVEQNFVYILNILKKFNPKNDILFLCNKELDLKILKAFKVEKDINDSVARKPFDKNPRLLEIISASIIDEDQKLRNMKVSFIKSQKNKRMIIQQMYRKCLCLFIKPYIHDKIYDI